jgi:hypothetical protein
MQPTECGGHIVTIRGDVLASYVIRRLAVATELEQERRDAGITETLRDHDVARGVFPAAEPVDKDDRRRAHVHRKQQMRGQASTTAMDSRADIAWSNRVNHAHHLNRRSILGLGKPARRGPFGTLWAAESACYSAT